MKYLLFAPIVFISLVLKSQTGGPLPVISPDFEKVKPNSPFKRTNVNSQIGNHKVFVDVLQLAFRQFSFGYEFLTDSDNVAFSFPISIGLKNKGLEFGVEPKFFITHPYTFYRKIGPWDAGDANVRYFLGPAISAMTIQDDWMLSARFSNGVSMQFVNGFNLSGYGSAGVKYFVTNVNGYGGDIEFDWRLNATVGWRFGGSK